MIRLLIKTLIRLLIRLLINEPLEQTWSISENPNFIDHFFSKNHFKILIFESSINLRTELWSESIQLNLFWKLWTTLWSDFLKNLLIRTDSTTNSWSWSDFWSELRTELWSKSIQVIWTNFGNNWESRPIQDFDKDLLNRLDQFLKIRTSLTTKLIRLLIRLLIRSIYQLTFKMHFQKLWMIRLWTKTQIEFIHQITEDTFLKELRTKINNQIVFIKYLKLNLLIRLLIRLLIQNSFEQTWSISDNLNFINHFCSKNHFKILIFESSINLRTEIDQSVDQNLDHIHLSIHFSKRWGELKCPKNRR